MRIGTVQWWFGSAYGAVDTGSILAADEARVCVHAAAENVSAGPVSLCPPGLPLASALDKYKLEKRQKNLTQTIPTVPTALCSIFIYSI